MLPLALKPPMLPVSPIPLPTVLLVPLLLPLILVPPVPLMLPLLQIPPEATPLELAVALVLPAPPMPPTSPAPPAPLGCTERAPGGLTLIPASPFISVRSAMRQPPS
ncbi:hypothetical protein SD70_32250 [Gordoniibacillus kamchatkensis]|uniref:Uncharacterized protein n=1 Tax=Gordoniibacillus kamchatkensis TaxID=1590651 RepID=A0ABR5A2X7_9BACL|nr:hypothetical protein SD70_32250 [Paenibacillus sp. VKM B-2647]